MRFIFCRTTSNKTRCVQLYADAKEFPLPIAIVMCVLWVLVIAAFYATTEGWGYGFSFYFLFQSFATIGLGVNALMKCIQCSLSGDLAPRKTESRLLGFALLLIGLSLVSMLFNVIAIKVLSKWFFFPNFAPGGGVRRAYASERDEQGAGGNARQHNTGRSWRYDGANGRQRQSCGGVAKGFPLRSRRLTKTLAAPSPTDSKQQQIPQLFRQRQQKERDGGYSAPAREHAQ